MQSLADLALADNDLDGARTLITEFLSLARGSSDIWSEAMALNGLGDILRSSGDYVRAERAYGDAAALFNRISEHGGMVRGAWAGLPHNLGYVTLAQGDTRRATQHFLEAADGYQRYGPDWRGVAECVMGLGSVAVHMGQPLLAAQWFGAAEAALEALQTNFSPANRADYERALVCCATRWLRTRWPRPGGQDAQLDWWWCWAKPRHLLSLSLRLTLIGLGARWPTSRPAS